MESPNIVDYESVKNNEKPIFFIQNVLTFLSVIFFLSPKFHLKNLHFQPAIIMKILQSDTKKCPFSFSSTFCECPNIGDHETSKFIYNLHLLFQSVLTFVSVIFLYFLPMIIHSKNLHFQADSLMQKYLKLTQNREFWNFKVQFWNTLGLVLWITKTKMQCEYVFLHQKFFNAF